MLVYATTTFIGAFLMFALEPMVAKMLLPTLGGTPMVWNTCVVFFQAALLCGYAFAHVLRRLATLRAAAILLFLAVVAGSRLPIDFPRPPQDLDHATTWLLLQLLPSLGPVFFVLAAAGPSVQTWFSRTGIAGSDNPYVLYAASNAGSFAALLAYPALVEPIFRLASQKTLWSAGYALLIACIAVSAWLAARATSPPGTADAAAVATASPAARDRLVWFVLAFIPSSVMLGVTTFISTDVAAVPLLWIGPLTIYLLTFVLAFSGGGTRLTEVASQRMALPLSAVLFLMLAGISFPIGPTVALHFITFFAVAMTCHGMLASRRPPAARLTEFYLWIGAAGVAGGLFNTLVAPVLFRTPVEYPLMLLCAAAVPALGARQMPTAKDGIRIARNAVALGAVAVMVVIAAGHWRITGATALVAGAGTVVAFSRKREPLAFASAFAALWAASSVLPVQEARTLETSRTFFGVYHVIADTHGHHSLYHGSTRHGMQAVDPPTGEPLTYYHRSGPFGQAFSALPVMSSTPHVAVIGLGAGSLAAYAQPRQHWVFYEIDPEIERIARRPDYFTYLERCGGRCSVTIGDARLSLSRQPGVRFGLIVLDAFSSDAIPVHLVTAEAIDEYLAHLDDDGVMMFHISNRYLDLQPLLAGLGAHSGLTAFGQLQVVGGTGNDGRSSAQWVALARNPHTLEPLAHDERWKRLDTSRPPELVWTDDYSNILSVLRVWR
ncbi:MAG TPA: fused MFS/spermidine synthase [Vicinamibacterales bacterium]|nr:fused MFS/spermidine synthase [Vicinamibacterales bacterium]